jgi:hypothetical protein
MKHCLYLNGTEYTYDGVLPCTRVVIGQLDIAKERPAFEQATNLTNEQQIELAKFAHNATSGRFAVKPLEWCEDEAEAEAFVARFQSEGWINVSIVPVSDVIENA